MFTLLRQQVQHATHVIIENLIGRLLSRPSGKSRTGEAHLQARRVLGAEFPTGFELGQHGQMGADLLEAFQVRGDRLQCQRMTRPQLEIVGVQRNLCFELRNLLLQFKRIEVTFLDEDTLYQRESASAAPRSADGIPDRCGAGRPDS